MELAPILLFTYNRPEHTRRTLEALKKNLLTQESELFIFSDAAKSDADKEKVTEVRNVISQVDGFKKVEIIENTNNKGLAKNIIEGVTDIISKYGKVIVLEDDLITSSYFLTFMNDALTRYKDNEKIGHVHGYCYPDLNVGDAFLIKWIGSWGWGTWERAWKHFNADGNYLLKQLEESKLTHLFDFNGTYKYTRMLRRQTKGINNSWAIRWNASLFLKDILSLNAGESLVQNIGFDGTGTHSGNKEIWKTHLCNRRLNVDITPIEESKKARLAYQKYYRKTNGFWAKVKRRLLG